MRCLFRFLRARGQFHRQHPVFLVAGVPFPAVLHGGCGISVAAAKCVSASAAKSRRAGAGHARGAQRPAKGAGRLFPDAQRADSEDRLFGHLGDGVALNCIRRETQNFASLQPFKSGVTPV